MRKKSEEKNKFVIEGDLVYIHLVGKYSGRVAITDLKSYLKHELFNYTWRSSKGGYVYTCLDGKSVYLHRLITGNTGKLHTDHINNTDDPVKDKLDNRSCNLRIATNRQNQNNSRIRIDNSTGYKGVNIINRIYTAQSKLYGHKYYYGGFSTKKYEKALEMAAYAYDIASEWIYGEYANHNKIKESKLLTDEEMKIVEDVAYEKIEQHNLPKYQNVEIIEPTNIYTRKDEIASFGEETIS